MKKSKKTLAQEELDRAESDRASSTELGEIAYEKKGNNGTQEIRELSESSSRDGSRTISISS